MLFRVIEFIRKSNNLSMPHKGIVVDNKDPKKLNRVRCTIKGIYETEIHSDLPWIQPVLSNTSPSATSSTPPEINTELWVEFPFGLYQPVYKGYWYSKTNGIAHPDNSSTSIFGDDYPDIYGVQDSTGNYIAINKKKETFNSQHSSGDHIKIDKNGDVIITGVHNITLNNKGNVNINNDGDMAISNNGKVDVTSINSDITVTASVGNISIMATQKVKVQGTAGVEVVGSLVRLASSSTLAQTLIPTLNGVITGLSPCILAGIPHTNGSSTVLAPYP